MFIFVITFALRLDKSNLKNSDHFMGITKTDLTNKCFI